MLTKQKELLSEQRAFRKNILATLAMYCNRHQMMDISLSGYADEDVDAMTQEIIGNPPIFSGAQP